MPYYLRHGQCEANAKKVFAGQEDDSDLTELGERQPVDAAKDAKRRGLRITRIICSPLIRTTRTAEIFADEYGLGQGDIQQDPRLLERKMGVISGTPVAEAPAGDWSHLPGVEPLAEVEERAVSFWEEHRDDPELLVVGHDGTQKVPAAKAQGIPLEELYKLPSFPQDQVVEVDLSWL